MFRKTQHKYLGFVVLLRFSHGAPMIRAMTDQTAIVKNKSGRPSQYTEAIGDEVCNRLADGAALSVVSGEVGFHASTIRDWAEQYPRFGAALARAEQVGFDSLADRLLWIPKQDGDVQRQRLESDNIKWVLARRAARVYGDRIDVTVNNTVDVAGALNEARARILRPVCDQLESDDAETVDFIDVPADGATDTQSDTSESGAGLVE